MKVAALNRPAKASRPADSAGFVEWLDALVTGTCTEDEVLAHVQRLEESDRDVAWECLAQLDQQFRRKRVPQPLYASLKSRLQKHSLGVRVNAAVTSAAAPVQAAAPVLPDAPAAARATPLQEVPAARLPSPSRTAASPSAARPAPLRHEAAPRDEEPLAPRALRVGDVLRGRYRLVDVLTEDESGTLYESIDELNLGVPGSRPRVAIRVLANDPVRMPERLRRLSSLQALSHPGIVRLFNVDEERGNVFVTMELPGSTLRHALERSHAPLATPAAMAVVRSIASALAYAHSQGVHHGDIRAEHVFLDRAGDARLGGFEKNDDAAASVDGDRLAFAWFAYGLLSGTPGSLRAPSGLTRAQWQALRDTLTGNRGPKAANLLPLLAGDDRSSPATPAVATTPPPRRLVMTDWIAIAIVVAIFAAGAALVVRENGKRNADTAVASVATVPPAAEADAPVPPQDQAAAPRAPGQPAEAVRETDATPQPLPAAPAAAPAPAAEPVAEPVFAQARMYFPVNFLEIPADEPVARLWVRRQGRMSGTASFRWWTESGTAEADRHFRRIAPVVAEIPAGARGVELIVPLVPGAVMDRPRTFYVRIDEPDARSTLGDEVLMQVVIVPPARAGIP